jgi:methyl-accepting chemotaxis protein
MEGANRRKRYIVDKKFQIKFILRFCFTVILVSLAIGISIFYSSLGSTTVAIENTRVVVKHTQDFILPMLIAVVIIVTMSASAAVFFSTLFSTHKIAGPIYRLSKEVDKLKQGDLTRNFKIRSKDEFQELAKNLNEMGGVLRINYSELKNKLEGLKGFLRERNYSVSGQDKEVFLNRAKEIDNLLDYFKV